MSVFVHHNACCKVSLLFLTNVLSLCSILRPFHIGTTFKFPTKFLFISTHFPTLLDLSFAKLSVISFPCIPTCAFTFMSSILRFLSSMIVHMSFVTDLLFIEYHL